MDASEVHGGDSLAATVERAEHWIDIDRQDLARDELGRALGRWPDESVLHELLAKSFQKSGRAEEALDEAKTALSLDPESIQARSILALVLMDLGRNSEAETHLLEALKVDPTSPFLYYVYSALLYKTGHLAKAEALVRKGLALNADFSAAHSLLAQILAEKERSKVRANQHAAEGLSLDPGSDYSHLAAGHTHLISGRPFAARRHLREALRLDPSDRDVEEAWLEADKCCRVIYLPYYYWSLLLQRVPAGQYVLWGGFVLFVISRKALGIPPAISALISIPYISFVLYTWVAEPLVKLWLKVRPPR